MLGHYVFGNNIFKVFKVCSLEHWEKYTSPLHGIVKKINYIEYIESYLENCGYKTSNWNVKYE